MFPAEDLLHLELVHFCQRPVEPVGHFGHNLGRLSRDYAAEEVVAKKRTAWRRSRCGT
jgi:hypothetical protein